MNHEQQQYWNSEERKQLDIENRQKREARQRETTKPETADTRTYKQVGCPKCKHRFTVEL